MRRGSITVFLALVLVLITSFLFSLLEGARVHCLKAKAQRQAQICMQSMFGNYHEGIWEDYHLLFLDGTWQETDFSMDKFVYRALEETRKNISFAEEYTQGKYWDFTGLEIAGMEVLEYALATDHKGALFQEQVTQQMKREAVSDVLEELKDLAKKGETAKGQEAGSQQQWEQAWEAREQAKELTQESVQGQEASQGGEVSQEQEMSQGLESLGQETSQGLENAETLENPMDYVKELKSSSVLALVVEPEELSGKALTDANTLERRMLQQGNWQDTAGESLENEENRLWLQYFVGKYFSDFGKAQEEGAKEKVLSYEVEYILSGKTSDKDNLEAVVTKLLAIREAMNFVTIMQDNEKKGLALGIATAAVGFTGILPLVKAVQAGILLAWAFVESVLDVRTLMDGEKVPFLKAPNQWSSDVTAVRDSINTTEKSSGEGEGFSYAQYLQLLLFFQREASINYRCMDVIERNHQVKMDNMVHGIKGVYDYQAKPLFWNFNVLIRGNWDYFSMPVEVSFGYGGN